MIEELKKRAELIKDLEAAGDTGDYYYQMLFPARSNKDETTYSIGRNDGN